MRCRLIYSLIFIFYMVTNLYAQADLDRPVNIPEDMEYYSVKQLDALQENQEEKESENAVIKDTLYIGHARAFLKGIHDGSVIRGEVYFNETKEGLYVTAIVSGVPAGKHGLHIKEGDDCWDKGNIKGKHDKFPDDNNGNFIKDYQMKFQTIDMGNIIMDENEHGTIEIFLPEVSLTGEYGILGKSVILHQYKDDFTKPDGNAGPIIGCGVIEEIH